MTIPNNRLIARMLVAASFMLLAGQARAQADAAVHTVVNFFCRGQLAGYDASSVDLSIDNKPLGMLTNFTPGTRNLRIRTTQPGWWVKEVRYQDIGGRRGEETYQPNAAEANLPLVFTARPSRSALSRLEILVETCAAAPARATPPTPPPVIDQGRPCGAALLNQYDRLLGARVVLRQQRDKLSIVSREDIAAGVERLDRVAVQAALNLENMANALDNVFLRPLAGQIETAVKAGISESAKRKIAEKDLAGAALDGLEGFALKDQVQQRQQERKKLQLDWMRKFQRQGVLAKSIARQIPWPGGQTKADFDRQIDDLDLRLDRLRGLAEESRCELPRSMIPRNAGFQDEAVLLGIHPPLTSQAPAISEEEAMMVLGIGFIYTTGKADVEAAQRNRPGTTPITREDTERIGAIGARLADIWETGNVGNPLEQGTRITTTLPGSGARAGAARVATPEARITPTGTVFLVHRDAQRGWTFVHVGEGAVEVAPVRGGAALTLAAGQSALVTAAGAERLRPGGQSAGGGGQPGGGGQSGGGGQTGGGGQFGGGGQPGASGGACFGNDRGAASTRRKDHLDFAQRYPAQVAANLRGKIDLLWRCPSMNKERLDAVFADLSAVIPRYLNYAGCFRNDVSVIGAAWQPHRDWARQRTREQGLDNVQWKMAAALGCLNGIGEANFYADASIALAKAAPGQGGDPGVVPPPPVIYPPPIYPPPVTYPPQPGVKASDWLNRDRPDGNADWEALADQRGSVPCAQPSGIECRVASDKRDWRQAGQRYKCSLDQPNPGGICLNSDNPGGCLDYEVRFICPGSTGTPPVTGIFDRFPPAIGAQGPSTGRHGTPPAPMTTPSAWPRPTPAFIGCYKDTSDFDLNGYLERSAQNTPQRCVALCQAKGFAYAGVQYGESCLCGNRYGKYGAANNCNYPCTGDRGQMCGGYNANSVYSTGVGAAQGGR